MKWYKIPGVPYTNEPFITKVKIGGKSICLVGFEGQIYALLAICPHAGADLSEGLCVKGKIVCPYHRYTYNLETGKGGEGQNDFVTTYLVDIRDDGIYVGIKSFWDRLSGK
ncbi:nitrite reductase (NADH) small subunit/3-phenylpropionate/trans-cinnamate dioxygenase ferredoxin subunit [Mucilaginibacter lappiensis]|uniref:Nitrite reductase (NADH) small subunit/3-phenylpropionate/trans-cinnamate dioxygenase ferredoxin subunit n=1 Tax=Mucilaginibacter lappiensis TaxID=354630 RepID=A0ABR6PI26_9SPHI|nr:Rieske (2Fe-2S) protein [Mucilaginibacter lappiensis]MBB6109413.1 nitrite reductase (NADH) small subunit/3-phenylpropionate/trans-cinnamate dioxygenase ferredoxin subunit [Mucilaginibacter lappiensis]SIQ96509.1 nitrite reductase (NADH) small subunit/3-phenylpropionate/trans-cinnamate dioxygenase ferredoxin subunit [Mucilaginibacter lappiensis]